MIASSAEIGPVEFGQNDAVSEHIGPVAMAELVHLGRIPEEGAPGLGLVAYTRS